MTEDRPVLGRLCRSCGIPLSRHNAFFVNCRDYRVPHAISWRDQDSAARGGAKAAATKRARGQDLIPTLHLSGTNPKTAWRTPDANAPRLCQCSVNPCASDCQGRQQELVSAG